jgi:tetratricopeptide (TPR) repeat protein
MDAQAYLMLSGVYGNRVVSWGMRAEVAEHAVEIDPLWSEAGKELALALSYLPHRANESEAIFSRLLELYPDNPRILRWKSYWLEGRGQLAQAVKAAEASLLGDPDWPPAHWILQRLWYRLGQPERASQLKPRPIAWAVLLDSDRSGAANRMAALEAEFGGVFDEFEAALVSFTYLQLHRPEDALRILGYPIGGGEQPTPGPEFMWARSEESPLMTLATAFRLLGQVGPSEHYLTKELEALDIRSENGVYKNADYWRVMARANALRGEDYPALLALERLTEQGPLDPRELMHPAYDGIRHSSEFAAIAQRRADLINRQRALLGLQETDLVAYQAGF